MKRYYICNESKIPYKNQPENGYTELRVVSRCMREIQEMIRLFGGKYSDYIGCFTIIDNECNECKYLYNAL